MQDIELAKERMARVGRAPEGKPYTAKVILGYFLSWKTVLFTIIFSKSTRSQINLHSVDMLTLLNPTVVQPFGSQPATSFVFWLKAHNKKGHPPVYTVAQIVSSITLAHARVALMREFSYRTNTRPYTMLSPLSTPSFACGSLMDP